MVARLAREVALLHDRARFVRLVVEGQLQVESKASAKVCADMRRFGLRTKQEIEGGDVAVTALEPEASSPAAKRPRRVHVLTEGAEAAHLAGPSGYGWLLRAKMWLLTEERLAELVRQFHAKLAALEELRGTTTAQLWERDLTSLEQAMDARDAEDRKDEKDLR
ncbi:unnamed protein product [Prorocentrum cordatum]|nr:unnamed protein product [Polarella glacialis]